MTRLWLLRHGQTDWNVEGRWQGQTERAPGLNAVGRAQALAIRGQLKEARFSAIYSSDLLRSQQTAEWLAEPLGLNVALMVDRLAGLRGGDQLRTDDSAATVTRPAFAPGRWLDAAGRPWQSLDLAALARDEQFLSIVA